MEPLLQWGINLIIAIQQVHGPALDNTFRAITFLGEADFYLLLLPLIFWCVDSGLGARLAILVLFSSYLNVDLKDLFQRIAPKGIPYGHDKRWGDGNGHSHVRATLLGPSLTIPFCDKKLILGTWQQVILIDFDNRSRTREIVLQIQGE